MFRNAIRTSRAYPITAGCVALCILLHLAVVVLQIIFSESEHDAFWHLGAIKNLLIVGEPNLKGPFDLWDGEVWRIPVSTFHHGNFIHLVFNVLGTAFLGCLLEARMGPLRYLAFILLASIISSLPHIAFEEYGIGFSGVVYAIFGVLYVMRRRDESIATYLTEWTVRALLIWLFLCILLTYLEFVRIGNLAHFSGFIYGWGVGKVLYDRSTAPRAVRMGFYAFHLLLVPAVYCVVHPVWNGRYHWYLAAQETDLDEKVAHWQRAVDRNPSLPEPWQYLARVYGSRGNLLKAWTTMVKGLSYNRSYQEGIVLCRGIWKELKTEDERTKARIALQKVFQEEADAWWERLGIRFGGVETVAQHPDASQRDPVQRRFQQQFVSPNSNEVPSTATSRDQHAPKIDPDAWHSALAGESM